MDQNVLEVHNLTKDFGKFKAVDSVSFNLPQGQILGFLGPNGAGKTTTIQMLLGLLIPSSGKITYFGKNFEENRREIMEKINFSSTYVNMPWRITIRECLYYTSHFYRVPEKHKRVNKLIKSFRLTEIKDKQVSQLSAGQQTRLMLAKGFINNPEILLLDEPTASMDPETAQYVRDYIIQHKKKNNFSVLFTSHNMSEVEDVCDEVVFINKGKIIAQDKPYALARKIKISHISLLIKDGLKRTISICKKKKLQYELKNRFIIIDVHEKDIPYFLKNLLDKGIEYHEISIEKPDLEDYFLEIAQQH